MQELVNFALLLPLIIIFATRIAPFCEMFCSQHSYCHVNELSLKPNARNALFSHSWHLYFSDKDYSKREGGEEEEWKKFNPCSWSFQNSNFMVYSSSWCSSTFLHLLSFFLKKKNLYLREEWTHETKPWDVCVLMVSALRLPYQCEELLGRN